MGFHKSDQQRRTRLNQLRSALDKRQIPVEPPGDFDRPRSEAARQALVEQRIQQAMKDGLFDNLPGKGKPLPVDRNPYLEPGQELAFGLLKNNGFAPEWIERDKEIRRELQAARDRLRRAWQQSGGEAAWPAAVARFEESLNKLNRKIDDFNLIVPVVSSQRPRLRLADEIRRVQQPDQEERKGQA